MRVLITGATGLVGTQVVRRLLSKGYSVIVLVRSPSKAESLFGSKVKAYSLRDTDKLEGIDAVINLAGEAISDGRWTIEKKRKIFDSRVEGTKQLIQMIERNAHKPPSVFVSTSAVGIYGDAGETRLTEESELGNDFLAQVCKAWEEQARRVEKFGTKTAILRFGIVISKDRGAIAKMLPFFKHGLGGPIAKGTQWMSWIHIDDLVALILQALEDPSLSGTYNAVSPNPIRNSELVEALSTALGKHNLFRVPALALKFALGEMATLLLSSQRVIPKRLEDAHFEFRYTNIESALNELINPLLK